MSQALALDLARLEPYLAQHLPGFAGPLTATKFKGGQSNPTYALQAESGKYVLRRKPPGALLPSAHAVDREFRVLHALYGSPVAVAEPVHLCADETVIGSMFYLMAFVPGVVHLDPALPQLPVAARAQYFDAAIDTLARLHALDPSALGLADFGKPGNYFARQIHRWTGQYRASQTTEIAAIERLIEWLPAHCPADDGSAALVHGDYRIDNLMFAPDRAQVLAVFDWELATLGHPLADLAYFCMALRLPPNPVVPGLAGLDRAALGIPDEHAMIDRYQRSSGRPINDWNFALAFNFFRLAAIAQGVAKRARDGNASSEQAQLVGRMASTVAELGAALT